jgi:hypothetical protein
MSIFTASEMAGLKALQLSSLTDSVDIKRMVLGADGFGGQTATNTTAASSVPCRIRAMTSTRGEEVLAGRLQGRTPWEITLPTTTDVRESDTIVFGSITYEVIAVRGPGTYMTAIKVVCAKK